MIKYVLLAGSLLWFGTANAAPPMPTVDYVDLPRFMGDWYVIANIPTALEKGAHNPLETYRLDDDGTIATTFSFNADSFAGEKKIYHPRGFVKDKTTNAHWGMQFIWPIKADYRVVYLDEDYRYTIIARKARDYVWVMARSATIDAEKYQQLIDFVVSIGYSADKIVRAPHEGVSHDKAPQEVAPQEAAPQ